MDYQIMEDFDDETQVYGDTPGGDHMMNQQEMPVERKLQLAERANEIYREQVKYLQEHLNNIRALVQDKESIIENLMLRYDLGILLQDPARGAENISSDKIEDKELRRKAEALAQRTILENFELRELVNELRDENFHLRNEIYDLQDRLNRQALHISKMTKNAQNQPNQYTTQPNYEVNDYAIMNGNHPEAENEEAQRKREERADKHKRQQSSMAQPQDFWDSGINPEEEDPETDEEKPRKVARNTDEDDAREQEQEAYMDEEARRKQQERQAKAHEKKESAAVPEQFFDEDYSPDKAAANGNANDRPNKRRGSKQLDGDPTQTEEAKAKRQERQDKTRRQESIAAPPGMFETDPANTEEAKKVREDRAKKIRKESIALPKGFLNSDDPNGSEDDASREKRRKHQRKQSLMKAVGDKGHLSDEDTEKTQHVDYEARKKSGLVDRSRQKGKEAGASDKPDEQNKPHHRRDSSMPIPDLKFEDPNTLAAMAQEEVKELKQKLNTVEQEKKLAEKQLQDNKKETEQMEQKLTQQLEQKLTQQLEQKITQQVEKRLEEKFQKEKFGLAANNKKDLDQLSTRIDDLKTQLTQATTSKVQLIECTSNEINRLNRVINGLLQSERCKEITRLILEDNGKQA